jgi:prephenate dehydrogenase
MAAGLIDVPHAGYENAGKAVEQSDLAILCTPIDHILEMLEGWGAAPLRLERETVITDVGSTKDLICAMGKKAFPAASQGVFIGSHPMAGSEKTGIKARDGHLFENATWVVCPDKEKSPKAERGRALVESFAQGLGARTYPINPQSHDLIVAMASHLPQMLSTALAAYVGSSDSANSVLEVAGGGFRDMTRLASSSFAVWEPILRTNRHNLEFILPTFRRELEAMEVSLSKDGGESFFTEANELRKRFSGPRKGFTSPTTEILLDLEDKPGMLLAVLAPLAQKGLNVLDLEILKVREGEEGVLMMGFRHLSEAEAALKLLAESGHKARLR